MILCPKVDCVWEVATPLKVIIVNGDKVETKMFCPKFKWSMQGHNFSTAMQMLSLESCDIVLGAD